MRILSTLAALFLLSTTTISAQIEFLNSPGLQLEFREGHLYGYYDNLTIGHLRAQRIPTSAIENMCLYIVRNDTGDTLQFSEFHFVFDPDGTAGGTFFRYDSVLLVPAQRLPLFEVKIAALENISWDQASPRAKSKWVRNNRLTPGTYTAFFDWTHIEIPIIGISNTIAFQIP